MRDLGRVNLLIGTNNSGKTSILEALHLLTSQADPISLWRLLWRRGERAIERSHPSARGFPEVEVSHLFTGHGLHVGSSFQLSAENQNPQRFVRVTIDELSEKERGSIRLPDGSTSKVGLRLKGTPRPVIDLIPLSSSGALSSDSIDTPRRPRKQRPSGDASQFLTTEAMDGDDLVRMWDSIALTPDEDLVLRTLSCLDRGIERIAPQASSTPNYWGSPPSRSGFIIKHKQFENPVPIGSMGDGIWRLLSLSIAITQSRGGVLLVDEIDTGLHHTAMSDMWRLIISAAQQFDVQVFATTHSSDCVNSLALNSEAYLTALGMPQTVTFQRLERDHNRATPYSPEDVQIAARHSVEIR